MEKQKLINRAIRIGMNITEAEHRVNEIITEHATNPESAARTAHHWNLITTDRQYGLIVTNGII